MTTLFKILAWLAGGVVLLVAGFAIYITLGVDPNEHKPEITSIVEKQIGRKVTIQGDLELTLLPFAWSADPGYRVVQSAAVR